MSYIDQQGRPIFKLNHLQHVGWTNFSFQLAPPLRTDVGIAVNLYADESSVYRARPGADGNVLGYTPVNPQGLGYRLTTEGGAAPRPDTPYEAALTCVPGGPTLTAPWFAVASYLCAPEREPWSLNLIRDWPIEAHHVAVFLADATGYATDLGRQSPFSLRQHRAVLKWWRTVREDLRTRDLGDTQPPPPPRGPTGFSLT